MTEMYLSCAKDDRTHEIRLRQTLRPLLQRLGMSLWGREDIAPGQRWQEEMKQHLAQSSYFVPVLSASFFASDMCDVELKAAQFLANRHALKIIPVLVRPCAYEYSGVTQIVPLSGKPVANYRNVDEAWMAVHDDMGKLLSNAKGLLQ